MASTNQQLLSLIAKFNETYTMQYNTSRTSLRNDAMKELYSIIKNSKTMFDIKACIKHTTPLSHGEIMFCLALICQKIQNHRFAYSGLTFDDDIYTFVLQQGKNTSNYIQDYARTVILHAIKAGALSDKQKIILKEYVVAYNAGDDADAHKRTCWMYDVMLSICDDLEVEDLYGCLIGQCVGDALGFQVEGYGPDVCKKYVDEYVRPVKVPRITRIEGMTFGQYTDDSQLARELLVSIVETNGKVDAGVYAKRMALFFQPNNYRIVGYGKTCAQALEAVWNGAHHSQTGCTVGHGNGSAMRSAPIGILYASASVEKIVEVSYGLSRITHARPRCMAGAAAVALATKFAVATKKMHIIDVKQFCRFVSHTGDKQLDTMINMIPDFMSWRHQEVCDYVVRMGLSDGESKWDGISAGVTQTVLWSLYCFCKHYNSYIDCIAEAISVGGDVDTTAAIAGALSGARLGATVIPDAWVSQLHDIEDWDTNELSYLVEKVVRMCLENSTTAPPFRFD